MAGRPTSPRSCRPCPRASSTCCSCSSDGRDNVEIGNTLHLSPSTIKHHVSKILSKLGVENRVQAAVLAVRQGLAGEQPRG